jgi:3'(2'), 5'-bisphosphate nucleotidase
MTSELTPLIEPICALAEQAGRAILGYYHGGFTVRAKSDTTPVTEADEIADAIIVRALLDLLPGVAVVSEETGLRGGDLDLSHRRFWCVDPLDGTKEFIARRDEFTVNIALIENGRPVFGVVHAPARNLTYCGAGPHTARLRKPNQSTLPIAARRPPDDGLVALTSRWHDSNEELDAHLARFTIKERRTLGSSLKFCELASGAADIYIRLGPTSEWDTAAGQAVLEAAGGSVMGIDGSPFVYGKPEFLNSSFVALGNAPGLARDLTGG